MSPERQITLQLNKLHQIQNMARIAEWSRRRARELWISPARDQLRGRTSWWPHPPTQAAETGLGLPSSSPRWPSPRRDSNWVPGVAAKKKRRSRVRLASGAETEENNGRNKREREANSPPPSFSQIRKSQRLNPTSNPTSCFWSFKKGQDLIVLAMDEEELQSTTRRQGKAGRSRGWGWNLHL